jgi:hypothetical protein
MTTKYQEQMLYLNESLCTVTEIFTTVTFDILEIDFDYITDGCDYSESVSNLAKLLEGKVTADDMPMENRDWVSTVLVNALDLVISLDRMSERASQVVGQDLSLPTGAFRQLIAELANS